MKSSEILRDAKKLLWDGRGPNCPIAKRATVCYASCRGNGWGDADSAHIRQRIMVSIHPYNTVTGWVAAQLGVRHDTLTNRQKQQYRHAWVDHLIATYEAEGD
jgi:hypothetical protein